MYRAGTVVRAVGGIAVLRAADDTHPEIGTTTVDERLTEVGEIVDIFGPVQRPYLAVSPTDRIRPPSLVGDVLYVRE